MKGKKLDFCGKIVLTFVLILFAVIAAGRVNVYADGGEMVRVSTVKQLKKAMKNPDVGVIILRTEAYTNITINPVKGSEEKFITIDAPNANITNKAVFAGISIGVVKSYTECASGNKIAIDGFVEKDFVVAKKKQLESLTYIEASFAYPEYILRKGAKLNNLVLIYTGNDATEEFTYDAKKRLLTLETTAFDFDCAYVIKLDKSGRMVKNTCTIGCVEFAHDYTFKYDKNGNLIKVSGRDNENGVFTTTNTYENNLLTNMNFVNTSFTALSGETRNTYDENGYLIHKDYHGIDSIDDQIFETGYSSDYMYDEKGRLLWMYHEDADTNYTYEMVNTYNSKGFLTETYENNGGGETVAKYKYSKAGDMIRMEYKSESGTQIYEYKYNEYGDLKGIEEKGALD